MLVSLLLLVDYRLKDLKNNPLEKMMILNKKFNNQ